MGWISVCWGVPQVPNALTSPLPQSYVLPWTRWYNKYVFFIFRT
jgi:hypothetical protein